MRYRRRLQNTRFMTLNSEYLKKSFRSKRNLLETSFKTQGEDGYYWIVSLPKFATHEEIFCQNTIPNMRQLREMLFFCDAPLNLASFDLTFYPYIWTACAQKRKACFFFSFLFFSRKSGPVQTTHKLSGKKSENHQAPFTFLIKKCSLGTYKRCKNYLNHYLKQTEKRNEKRGSISYAARTAKHSPTPEQSSVPGVSLCSSWPCYPIIR